MAEKRSQAQIVQSQIDASSRSIGKVKTKQPIGIYDYTGAIDQPTEDNMAWKVRSFNQAHSRCLHFDPCVSGLGERGGNFGWCMASLSNDADITTVAAKANWLRLLGCSDGMFTSCSGYNFNRNFVPHPKLFTLTSNDITYKTFMNRLGNFSELNINPGYNAIYEVDLWQEIGRSVTLEIRTDDSIGLFVSGHCKFNSGKSPNTNTRLTFHIPGQKWTRVALTYYNANTNGKINVTGNILNQVDAWRYPPIASGVQSYYTSFSRKEPGSLARWVYALTILSSPELTSDSTGITHFEVEWKAPNIMPQWHRQIIPLAMDPGDPDRYLTTVSGTWKIPPSEDVYFRSRAVNLSGDPGQWSTVSGIFSESGNVKPGPAPFNPIRTFTVTKGMGRFDFNVGVAPGEDFSEFILVSGAGHDAYIYSDTLALTAGVGSRHLTLFSSPTINPSGMLVAINSGYNDAGEIRIIEGWNESLNRLTTTQPLISSYDIGTNVYFYPIAKRVNDTSFSIAHNSTDTRYFNVIGRDYSGGLTDFAKPIGGWPSAALTITAETLAFDEGRPFKPKFSVRPAINGFNIYVRPDRRVPYTGFIVMSGCGISPTTGLYYGWYGNNGLVVHDDASEGARHIDVFNLSVGQLNLLQDYPAKAAVIPAYPASGLYTSLSDTNCLVHTISGLTYSYSPGVTRVFLNRPLLRNVATGSLVYLPHAHRFDSTNIFMSCPDKSIYSFNVAAIGQNGDISPCASGHRGIQSGYDMPCSALSVTRQESYLGGPNIVRNGSFEMPKYDLSGGNLYAHDHPLNYWYAGSGITITQKPRRGYQAIGWSGPTISGMPLAAISQDIFNISPSLYNARVYIDRYTSFGPTASGIVNLYWECYSYSPGYTLGKDFDYSDLPPSATFIKSGEISKEFALSVDPIFYDEKLEDYIDLSGLEEGESYLLRINIYRPYSPHDTGNYDVQIDDVAISSVLPNPHIYDEGMTGERFSWETMRLNKNSKTTYGDHLYVDNIHGLQITRKIGNPTVYRTTDPSTLYGLTTSGHMDLPRLVAWYPSVKLGAILSNPIGSFVIPSGRALMISAKPVRTFRDVTYANEITVGGSACSYYHPSGGEKIGPGSVWYDPAVHAVTQQTSILWTDHLGTPKNVHNGKYIIASGGDVRIKSISILSLTYVHPPKKGNDLSSGTIACYHACDVEIKELSAAFAMQGLTLPRTPYGLVMYEADSSSISK